LTISILRVSRILSGQSLDSVAAAVSTRKSWLSTVERFPSRHVSTALKSRLARHFSTPWPVLARTINGAQLAASICESISRTNKAVS
jgi:hypothetical protein